MQAGNAAAVQSDYLDRPQAAAHINMSVAWLRKQERLRKGPARIQCGKCVRYTRSALDEFMRARTVAQ